MKLNVYNPSGESIAEFEGDDRVFGIAPHYGVAHSMMRAELLNARQGNAVARNRALQHGSRKKPWRQKGTGHARQGFRRAAQWRGGGAVFGPETKEYVYKIPKKVKHLGYRSVFSLKAQSGALKIVRDLSAPNGKTREIVGSLGKLTDRKRIVMICYEPNEMLLRSLRNVSYIQTYAAQRLSFHSLWYAHTILSDEASVSHIQEWLLSRISSS